MIKKVDINDLRIGMYIERLDASWLKHPFLFSKQKEIKTYDQIIKLKSAGVREVYINTELGLDLADPSTKSNIHPTVGGPPHDSRPGPVIDTEDITPIEEIEPVPLVEELSTAQSLYSSASKFVHDFFEDARAGRMADYKGAVPLVEGIIQSVFRNPNALSILASLRLHEEYTYTHSVNVAALTVVFGKHLGMRRKELLELGMGGVFHDIGKFKIPDEILKKPSRLTEKEFEVVKKHPQNGYNLMQRYTDMSESALKIILEHHERFEGSGYPFGLKGNEISKVANMVSIVDTYDALTADRAYRKALDPHFALKTMYQERRRRYYYDLLERFIKCLGIYPVGSLVKLTTGHYAIVIETTPDCPLSPTVKIMLDKNMRQCDPELVQLSALKDKKAKEVAIVEGLDPGKLTIKQKLLSQAIFN